MRIATACPNATGSPFSMPNLFRSIRRNAFNLEPHKETRTICGGKLRTISQRVRLLVVVVCDYGAYRSEILFI